MSNVGNKYKVGVLVIVSFALLILSLLSLGIMKYFRKTYEFMTVVESSVQGLEKGAKVKFKGVTIGEVSKIQITPKENVIYIFMKFDPNSFARQASEKVRQDLDNGDKDERFFRDTMEEGVVKGMRCQLQLAGITGALFVDISYYDPKKFPDNKRYELPEHAPPYLPSIPSVSIANILSEVQKSVVKISKVDFEKISDQIEEFLETANTLVKDADLQDTIKEVKRISNNIQELTKVLKTTFTKEKMEKLGVRFDKTLGSIDSTVEDINRFVNNTNEQLLAAKIPATTEAARDFLDKGTAVAEKAGSLEGDLKESVYKLNATLHALRELVDYLEKNPSAILRGKAEKPIVKP